MLVKILSDLFRRETDLANFPAFQVNFQTPANKTEHALSILLEGLEVKGGGAPGGY